jgi:transposase
VCGVALKKNWTNSKYVSLDEFANRKGYKGYKTTLIDLEHHQLLEIINSHKSEEICEALEKIPDDFRNGVEEVSIDMWGSFVSVVEKIFPNAKIVYDHFHVIQNINKELNKLRKILKVKGKGLHYLLMKNKEDLKEEEKEDLNKFLLDSPLLWIAYQLKEDLREIYRNARTPQSAQRRLKKWLRYAKLFFRKSAASIENHLDGVCNYFEHHLTSAITEGINTKIKLIKRRSYGLPNFEHLRLTLLACFDT